jgi:hypothetical protein
LIIYILTDDEKKKFSLVKDLEVEEKIEKKSAKAKTKKVK